MDGAMPPDRFDPWPPGIEPAVPIEGYANTFTHTPALAPIRRPATRTEVTGPTELCASCPAATTTWRWRGPAAWRRAS